MEETEPIISPCKPSSSTSTAHWDSIPLWISVNVKALHRLGFSMNERTFLKEYYFDGLHHAGILEKCGLPVSNAKQFYEERNRLYEESLRREAIWLPDAEDVLKHCAKRRPLGMLTGSRRAFIDAINDRLHLSTFFQAIVTYDETLERQKPDPFGLQLLSRKLNVPSQQCLYIGDQRVDVTAAHAAGMKVCLIRRKETPAGAEEGADFVIRTIGEVIGVVG